MATEIDNWEALSLDQLVLKLIAKALQSIGEDHLRVALYGFSGTDWIALKVTSDGKVVGVLG